jgi:hypothetical protein
MFYLHGKIPPALINFDQSEGALESSAAAMFSGSVPTPYAA